MRLRMIDVGNPLLLLAVIVAIGRPELAPTNGLARRPFQHSDSRCRRIAFLTLRSLNGVVSLISSDNGLDRPFPAT
jgi:hypothetical protein